MAAPKGHPRYGGRAKGTPNKATRDLKAIAREYTSEAMSTLVALLKRDDAPAAQLGAAKEILDRGYGKATQVIAGDADHPIVVTQIQLVAEPLPIEQRTPVLLNGKDDHTQH